MRLPLHFMAEYYYINEKTFMENLWKWEEMYNEKFRSKNTRVIHNNLITKQT